jgi:hypothetical protein
MKKRAGGFGKGRDTARRKEKCSHWELKQFVWGHPVASDRNGAHARSYKNQASVAPYRSESKAMSFVVKSYSCDKVVFLECMLIKKHWGEPNTKPLLFYRELKSHEKKKKMFVIAKVNWKIFINCHINKTHAWLWQWITTIIYFAFKLLNSLPFVVYGCLVEWGRVWMGLWNRDGL